MGKNDDARALARTMSHKALTRANVRHELAESGLTANRLGGILADFCTDEEMPLLYREKFLRLATQVAGLTGQVEEGGGQPAPFALQMNIGGALDVMARIMLQLEPQERDLWLSFWQKAADRDPQIPEAPRVNGRIIDVTPSDGA